MKLAKIALIAASPGSPPPPDVLPHPEKIFIPLDGPWGRAEAQVAPGQTVEAGAVVGRFQDPRLPMLRASAAGSVEGIRTVNTPDGQKAQAVVLQPLGDGAPASQAPPQGAAPVALAKALTEAGFAETDRHPWPFPARICSPETASEAFQLTDAPFHNPIETLIINGLDRQPGEMVRRTVLGHLGSFVVQAVAALKALSQASRVVLVYDRSAPPGGELLRSLQEQGVDCRGLENVYPSALTPVLVQLVTGKQVPQPASDPRLVGVAVIDVTTAWQLGRFLTDGTLPLEILVQVSSWKSGLHRLYRVPAGTPLEPILAAANAAPQPAKIVVGGPLLGYAQFDRQAPLVASDFVLVQQPDEVHTYNYRACINCGHCVPVCPMKLLPNELGKLCEYGRFHDAEAQYLAHCIECGLCAFVCPAKRPMVQLIRHGKREILEMRKES
ncbi:electron transport complex protein RnfC [Desulfacinum hydrothermale DSM 13146]|uniref:Electron transport complex protein RnfC n=1 Tax=Desulfacinum hydrothermale DSM 13146 TaxID=1121390 RepID=A0A1W1XU24_9BACT|nr:4Fe-4S binding protein [Desulfacinum hydrothermale]SMC27362.1 electron transport complex protein RnfC [Desulfacinum hydrothermale DSM 13146]